MTDSEELRPDHPRPPSDDPERWFEAFAEFSRALSEAVIDLPTLFDLIARRVGALFGDATTVRLLSDDGARFEVISFHAPDAATDAAMRDLDVLGPEIASESIFGRVVEAGAPLRIDRAQADALWSVLPPAYFAVIDRIGAVSAMLLPVVARGRAIGALTILRTRDPAHSARDLLLARHVADRVALTVDNARLFLAAQREVAERERADRAEQQARELEALERFRLVAENAWDVIYRYRIRPQRGFEYVSPSCLRQNGYTPDELYADPEILLRLVHPDDRSRLLDETPTPDSPRRLLVLRNLRKDGSVFWAEQHVRGVFDEEGRLVALEGIVRDVTDRKDREDELRHARDAAEALNREIEAFSYSVSHDLRAPLRHIDGFSLALLEDYADVLDDRGKDFLARVRKGSQRLSELIDALLSLSRLTRKEPVVTSVDLGAIAREVISDLASAEPDRAVDLHVEDGLVVETDERLVRVVLENLLGNAWKFTAHAPRARIDVGVVRGDGPPRFFVRDNGAGFDPVAAERLFRPFQRLHDDAAFAGSGIGLATVRRIVRRFGGDAWAEGAPDAGATFTFTLAGG